VLRALRVAVLAAAGASLAWLAWRFDRVSLPAGSQSPLLDVDGGAALVIDRRPPRLQEGDAVLFRGPNGELLLGRVRPAPSGLTPDAERLLASGALWIAGDRADVPVRDSRLFGPVERARVEGRVLYVFD
jgi:hypothetical protein